MIERGVRSEFPLLAYHIIVLRCRYSVLKRSEKTPLIIIIAIIGVQFLLIVKHS